MKRRIALAFAIISVLAIAAQAKRAPLPDDLLAIKDVGDARLSPDGRWLAYAAFEGDKPEIFVAATDGRSAPRRLSRNGGVLPRWRGNSGELFFVQLDGMMVAVDPVVTLPVPSLLFRVEGAQPNFTDYRDSERWFDYDVTADGQRFLIRQPVAASEAGDNLRVVIGWSGKAGR